MKRRKPRDRLSRLLITHKGLKQGLTHFGLSRLKAMEL
jgi:hypothetical protein